MGVEETTSIPEGWVGERGSGVLRLFCGKALEIRLPGDAPRLGPQGYMCLGLGCRKGKWGVSGTSRCSPLPLQPAFSLFQCQACSGHLGHIREQHTIRCGIINMMSLMRG